MRKVPIITIIINAVLLTMLAGAVVYFVGPKKKNVHVADERQITYHCPMHPTFLSPKQVPCPICGMNLVPVNADPKTPDAENAGAVKIDPAIIQNFGIQTEKAAIRSLSREIRTSATIVPDERRIKIITTKIMGYIERLHVDYTGQQVKKGQPLYEIYSPEIVSAQSEYLQVYNSLSVKDSGQLLNSARRRLRNWDVTSDQITELEKRGAPERTITVVSPLSGLVADKMIIEGQSIEPGMQLYKIIDYSKVWAVGALYQQDVPNVAVGQQAFIELDYFPGEKFRGTVSFVAPEMDIESRTLPVRLELANTSDLKIKPGMNASMIITAPAGSDAVTVSDQAVIHSGLRTLVIVAKGEGYFEPREVTIGRSAGGYTEILAGVAAGDAIVVSSQFLIDSESNLKTAVLKMNRSTSDSKEAVAPDTAAPGDAHEISDPETKQPKGAATAKVYICPMDPQIVSDKPAKCPICKMNLVPKAP